MTKHVENVFINLLILQAKFYKLYINACLVAKSPIDFEE